MNGKDGPTKGRRATPGRRTPPPEATGAEARYLLQVKEAATPVVVKLVDGETVRGVIEYYDRDMIKVNRDSGPNVFIRKSSIRYLYEETATEAERST